MITFFYRLIFKRFVIINGLVNFFCYGYVAKYEKHIVYEFILTKIDHIVINIIPFFKKYLVLE